MTAYFLARLDFKKVHCGACREVAEKEKEFPACIDAATLALIPDRCPVGFDNLTPADQRILEIRGLLASLNTMHLADRICEEYGVDANDLKILAGIEELLKGSVQTQKTGLKGTEDSEQ